MPDPTPFPLDQLAERGNAEDDALVLRDRTLNYGELRSRVRLLAGWIAENLDKGARIASWAAKGELTCLLPLAAARAGVVHVPINPLLKHAQAAYILQDSGASVLIGTKARIETLEANEVPATCSVYAEEDAWAAVEAAVLSLGPSSHDPNSLAAILYTSGSTGRPKGVMLSHANLWLGAVSVAHYLEMAADDVTLAVLPLSFDYGQSQLLSTWYAGGCVVPLDYLFPRDVVKACSRYGITTLASVPPLWVQLTEIEWADDASARMRRVTNSGGALTLDLVKGLQATFPDADIYPMYGLTEAFRSTYLDPGLVDTHPTSIGKAIPFAEILVISDSGELCGPGEEGELVHCGPLVAQGYWQDDKRTRERFKPAPSFSQYGGIAVWSGDRVVQDSEGLLHFVGRRDAMIKSSGNRISPQELEEAALASGMVQEAVAFGLPDERLGHAIHLVVRGEGGESQRRDFAKALAHSLPNFMHPQQIHWRTSMPLNPNGKIDRTRLLQDISA